MRFHDHAVPAQIILLWRKREAVDTPAEPMKLNAKIDAGRSDRFARPIGVDTELRIGPILEDGDFYREIVITKDSAAMRATFILLVYGEFVMAAAMTGRRRVVAARDQYEPCDRRHQAADEGMSHCLCSTLERREKWRSLRRSRRMPSRWKRRSRSIRRE